eukprot:3805936-Pleurochrysis_carterae.AAC.1
MTEMRLVVLGVGLRLRRSAARANIRIGCDGDSPFGRYPDVVCSGRGFASPEVNADPGTRI